MIGRGRRLRIARLAREREEQGNLAVRREPVTVLDAFEVLVLIVVASAVLFALVAIAGCATESASTLDATPLPACASLGCANAVLISKPCAERGVCECRPSRDAAPIACAP